jgi:hypothetical protein
MDLSKSGSGDEIAKLYTTQSRSMALHENFPLNDADVAILGMMCMLQLSGLAEKIIFGGLKIPARLSGLTPAQGQCKVRQTAWRI